MIRFDDPDLLARVESGSAGDPDELSFGLITMDRRGTVLAYNLDESRRSGLSPQRVVGHNFFEEVGPCTNNYLVAQRFHDLDEHDELDEEIDYVFTFRMRPTPVRLRMLVAAGSSRQYIAVRSR